MMKLLILHLTFLELVCQCRSMLLAGVLKGPTTAKTAQMESSAKEHPRGGYGLSINLEEELP